MKPSKWLRLITYITYGHKGKSFFKFPKAELYSIAVVESARGYGIADRLYEAMRKWLIDAGENEFCILVGENLNKAHKFYIRMGATPIARVTIGGKPSVVYIHNTSA